MPKKGRFYFIQCAGSEIRFRNILRIKKGDELEPMIQMEAKVGSKWSPIIRCDKSQHPFLHLDLFYKNGEQKKLELTSRGPSDAIVEVIEKLKQDWKELLEELQYHDIVEKWAKNQGFIKRELENAKKFLLNQAKHPEKIVDMRGEGVKGFSIDAILVRNKQGKS